MTLPDDFLLGEGFSDLAVAGAAPASDLRRWGEARPEPPAAVPADWSTAYLDQVARLIDDGIGSVRLTLEWARLEPENGHRDPEAVEAFRRILETAREGGVAVYATLFDTSLPGWFSHDERGFTDRRSRQYHWARHTELVGEAFGDLVAGWVPVFEPSRWAYRGWVTGEGPPGRSDDGEAFAANLEAGHLASIEAALRLRQTDTPVLSAQWTVPLFPARPDPDTTATTDAQAMTTVVDDALWGCWQRLLDEGTLQVPGRGPVAVPRAREAFDVLGFTYRHAAAVRGDGVLLPYPQALPTGPDGQVPWSEGLALTVRHVAESLPDHPILIAGHGIVTDDDERRAEYRAAGLDIAQQAVDEGAALRGLWWDRPG